MKYNKTNSFGRFKRKNIKITNHLYYDTQKQIKLIVYVEPKGVMTILAQSSNNIIVHASKVLKSVEKR